MLKNYVGRSTCSFIASKFFLFFFFFLNISDTIHFIFIGFVCALIFLKKETAWYCACTSS